MIAPTEPHQTYDIAIVGGGIAGLTLAIGLLAQNVKITVYEAAHHFSEIGGGVAFGPNAIRAMKGINPAIEEAFERVATRNLWPEKRDQWFEVCIGKEPHPKEGDQEMRLLGTHPCRGGHATTHRALFLDELVRLVPGEVAHFGKRVDAVKDLGGETGYRLTFHDGTTAEHKAVIGCDGVKSAVRLHVLGEDDPAAHAVYSGQFCHRALLPMDKAREIMGKEKAENNQLFLGPHGHITTFPIENGEVYSRNRNPLTFRIKLTNQPLKPQVVSFHTSETWPHEKWVIPSTVPEMLSDYTGWSPTLLRVLGEVKDHDLDIWALFDYPSASTFHKRNVCLSGDAAHASTPNQGSGAAMAIEDSYVLSSLVGEAQRKGKEVGDAFRAFDAVRRERTEELVTTSREAGLLWAMELPGVGDDEEMLVQHAKDRMDWIWDEDLDMEIEEGKKLL